MFLLLQFSFFLLFFPVLNEDGYQYQKDEVHRILTGQSEEDVHFFTSLTCHPFIWSKDTLRTPMNNNLLYEGTGLLMWGS